MTLSRALTHRPAAVAASVALCAGALVTTSPAEAATPAVTPQTGPLLTTAAASRAGVTTAAASRAGVTTATSTTAAAATAAATAAQKALALSVSVLTTAASLAGRPYRFGAVGPTAFDCSGYTKYVYSRWGITLPRTTQQQYLAARTVPKSALRVGDLIFFVSRGYAYHVAVYAGNGMIWHSPHSGSSVRKVKIWTSTWVAGRVI